MDALDTELKAKCIRRRKKFEHEQARRQKWRKRYFEMPTNARILYIETGTEILPESPQFCQTYVRSYPGVVVKSNEYEVKFQLQSYFNHYNWYLKPPLLHIEEDRDNHTQTITLPRSAFECLITDTKLITDVFVSHIQTMNLSRYWELALETFDLAHNNLSFQRKKCRYGRRCWDLRPGHLVHWKHT